MPPKSTLNSKNLEALGAPRLAELLIELSTGNAASKRRLRHELAGTASTGEVVRETRKRLTSVARSRTYADWTKRRALVADLDTQRRAIVEQVAKADPVQGCCQRKQPESPFIALPCSCLGKGPVLLGSGPRRVTGDRPTERSSTLPPQFPLIMPLCRLKIHFLQPPPLGCHHPSRPRNRHERSTRSVPLMVQSAGGAEFCGRCSS